MSSIEIVWPGESLTLDPRSPGFAHGFGLFETLCLRAKRIQFWEAHWQRLTGSARKLGIACPFEAAEALDAVKQLARALSGEGTIKLSLLREESSSKLLVYSRAASQLPERIGLLLESPFPIQEASPLAGLKTHNYLENLLVLEAAREAGCYEGLRLNSKGQLAEGAISNIFFHRDGAWHSPGRSSGLLPGVMRDALIRHLPVAQGNYTVTDLLSADAVFLSNASIGLLPVNYLLSKSREIQLRSRQHPCYASARSLLQECIDATAVSI